MRILSLFLLSALLILLSNCEKSTVVTESVDPPIKETRYWLSFKVTCWKNNGFKPVFCKVEIFKNEVSYEDGSTRDGWYASSMSYYLPTDKARIILKDISSNKSLSEVFNISPVTDPIWFIDSYDKIKTNNPTSSAIGHLHLGACD